MYECFGTPRCPVPDKNFNYQRHFYSPTCIPPSAFSYPSCFGEAAADRLQLPVVFSVQVSCLRSQSKVSLLAEDMTGCAHLRNDIQFQPRRRQMKGLYPPL
ncbi:uncharacterized protein PV07_01773 [Cladophialophora immunda]|uniref:Uncharacterized protein n=1 Tax=Cladophialophora immunda TaxID=569365 RepID=A0A0D2BBY1_9EURO|nr:uncharacterized protein PV07_01773 [Cladophialophora immunda]KIW35047.1 hypothetical protein PV07_01773 [Cladophialophora immunda]